MRPSFRAHTSHGPPRSPLPTPHSPHRNLCAITPSSHEPYTHCHNIIPTHAPITHPFTPIAVMFLSHVPPGPIRPPRPTPLHTSLHERERLPAAAPQGAAWGQPRGSVAAAAPSEPLPTAEPAPKPTAAAAAAEKMAAAAAAREEAEAVWARAGEQVGGGEVQRLMAPLSRLMVPLSRLMAPLSRLLLALQGGGRGGTGGAGGAEVMRGDDEVGGEGWDGREGEQDGERRRGGGEEGGEEGEGERAVGWVERVVRARGRAVRKKRWRATRRAQQTVAWQQWALCMGGSCFSPRSPLSSLLPFPLISSLLADPSPTIPLSSNTPLPTFPLHTPLSHGWPLCGRAGCRGWVGQREEQRQVVEARIDAWRARVMERDAQASMARQQQTEEEAREKRERAQLQKQVQCGESRIEGGGGGGEGGEGGSKCRGLGVRLCYFHLGVYWLLSFRPPSSPSLATLPLPSPLTSPSLPPPSLPHLIPPLSPPSPPPYFFLSLSPFPSPLLPPLSLPLPPPLTAPPLPPSSLPHYPRAPGARPPGGCTDAGGAPEGAAAPARAARSQTRLATWSKAAAAFRHTQRDSAPLLPILFSPPSPFPGVLMPCRVVGGSTLAGRVVEGDEDAFMRAVREAVREEDSRGVVHELKEGRGGAEGHEKGRGDGEEAEGGERGCGGGSKAESMRVGTAGSGSENGRCTLSPSTRSRLSHPSAPPADLLLHA
ncbi:unnamed protein product [Closterium sp. NIES-65]|nr:unnamed protein product [Closterium sp. NIES-65]